LPIRISVLVNGALFVDGGAGKGRARSAVKAVYLGEDADAVICPPSSSFRPATARPWSSRTSRSRCEGTRSRSLAATAMGKTGLWFNTIVGVTRYFAGKIALDGADITRLRPTRRAISASAGCRRNAISQIAHGA